MPEDTLDLLTLKASMATQVQKRVIVALSLHYGLSLPPPPMKKT